MTTSFSINFDYRCPFARNANEHVLAGLAAGADWDVRFVPFSLSQVHVEEGAPAVWEDAGKRPELLAVAAGIVVRDRFPDAFAATHLSLFAVRHDDGEDLRDEQVLRAALRRGGADDELVFKELVDGWPFATFRAEHERSVADHAAFGVPTFVVGERAAFVRVMTRPAGDGTLAIATTELVLGLLAEHPELNEFKHTSIPR
ncbi:MAG TPA: DsbA family protein [Acidimicrobiales bacterium]|nr:DsbA family protein [Acidimicrobiales bacterium]